jgi:heme-degrading monooxygenase HmoA
MYARVSRFAGLPPERIEATLRQFREEHLPALQQLEGYKGVQVLVDERGGQAIATTYWETRRDLDASDKLASQAREAAVSALDPDRHPLVDRYEVRVSELD